MTSKASESASAEFEARAGHRMRRYRASKPNSGQVGRLPHLRDNDRRSTARGSRLDKARITANCHGTTMVRAVPRALARDDLRPPGRQSSGRAWAR